MSVNESYRKEALDYLDKVVASLKTAGSRDRGSYETGKVVMEGLKAMAERRGMWIWTASQGRGCDDQTQVKTRGGRAKLKKLRQGDVCDSMWKSRLAAMIITINGDEDHLQTWVHVSKHTMGSTAGKTTDKMRTAFAVGRLTDGDEVFEDDDDGDTGR